MKVLVVDDESSIRELLSIALGRAGYEVDTAASLAEARERLTYGADLVLSDLMMPDGSGLDLLQETARQNPGTRFVMITAHSSAKTAIEALKLGAFDYVAKPFDVEELLIILRKALEEKELVDENRELKLKLGIRSGAVVGRSPLMQEVFKLVDRVAKTASTVLVTGESGTGKELVARAIHAGSPRSKEAFVSINCGAMPENLLESELFGHAKGAFTGALREKRGLFEEAAGGTLFLDEIGETTPLMQVKLLRVLQARVIRRVGDNVEIPIDTRVIAATNRDLAQLIAEGRFREDLYYRINVIPVHLPPLRARREDISVMATEFLRKYCLELGRPVLKLTAEALRALERYEWPGNVRELENVIERVVALEPGEFVTTASLPEKVLGGGVAPPDVVTLPEEGIALEPYLEAIGRKLMIQALERTAGVQTQAADLLGMSFRSFRYFAKKYGIQAKAIGAAIREDSGEVRR